MLKFIEKFNQTMNNPELAKLILRLGFATMFLLHGVHKALHGTDFVQGLFTNLGLPAELAYLAYFGEVIAPIAIIAGVFTRLFASVCVGNCIVVMILMHSSDFFSLTKVGAWSVESIATFFVGFLAIMLLGSGKYAIKAD